MAQANTVRKTLDLAKLATSLKLTPESTQALISFRKRHEELLRMVTELQEMKHTIDFNMYRSILKNKKVVDEAETIFKSYQPSMFEKQAQLKVIQAFETKALEKASEMEKNLNTQLKDLKDTIINIKEARPVEQLTTDDIVNAFPSIEQKVEKRSMKLEWDSPEFDSKFGSFALL